MIANITNNGNDSQCGWIFIWENWKIIKLHKSNILVVIYHF